jgi:hypothetical protein
MKKALFPDLYQKGFQLLGVLSAIGLAGYGLSYLFAMPEVNPERFVPSALETGTRNPAWFGPALAAFILLYAFTLLPVSVIFTIKKYQKNLYALVFAGCILGISLIIEIVNNLPVLAVGLYPGKLVGISPDILLYLKQVETIRYLSFDVAGFTLAYIAIFIYAVVYFKSHKLLAFTVFGSIVLFLASFVCLWFAPEAAVVMMAVSVLAFAPVPVILTRIAIE